MGVELYLVRHKPFRWVYFNWGRYYSEKRIVLEIYAEIFGKVRGFSIKWSREVDGEAR